MRAIAIQDFGDTPALHDLPVPQPGPGEVRVRVRAASVNGFDLAVAGGMLKGRAEHHREAVLGKDFAGVVDATGDGVSGFEPGDEVFGVVTKPVLGDGSFGEYVTVPTGIGITHRPAGLDPAAAGALGLAGTAALMAVEAVAPTPGETVLVAGATGGVGAYAVQLAAARGARVVATARPGPEAELVRGLGAAATVDYTGDLPAAVRAANPGGVHAVLHLAGDGLRLADLLTPGGRLASTLGLSSDQLGDRDVRATSVMAAPDASLLDRLAADAAVGRLRVPLDRSDALHEVPKALADFAAGTRGKLAITLGG